MPATTRLASRPDWQARQVRVPGKTCIACQSERDASRIVAGINRRGSKDSQLR